ncbi:siphovirus Gp157 family protein [Tissierella pigra]|uniref:siphovirus Gp157 family protein n=1 Tax=Tissierella pigra TaxID=2607614 RepID=UPI001C109AF7|nr:siphovirus Gp157 family protein [Tissierella pigra]MBU5424975.1 siphovirus Gp157 family protein [Tissierella pigra]
MSFKLYELTEMYQNISDLISDDEVGNEALEKALEDIKDNIELKAENMAKLIKNIDGDIEVLKTEEERLADRRKALENKKENIKTYLENQLKIMKVDKVKTPLFTVALQNNPQSVNILDEELIPNDYKKTVTTTSISRKDLLDDLKQGLIIDGVELRQTKSLRIR